MNDSRLRFDLAVQRSRMLVYTAGCGTALIGRALGAFPVRIDVVLGLWIGSCAISAVLYALASRGVDHRAVFVLSAATDVVVTTVGVYATGGIGSPWFIWYLPCSASAAFVSGKRAAIAVSIVNCLAYLGVLMFMGQATLIDHAFLIALARMIFLVGASWFFLAGIANLQEKRLRIRQLEQEESEQLDELRRMATALAEANRRIQDADRLKSQFLANMSHELRTPMNSIIGFSEILVERLENKVEEKHLSFLRHILASGQHLLSIINDILDLSKIEAGKMEIYPEYFAIQPVIESVCHVMRGMSKTIPTFRTDIPNDLPQIETDLAKFKQILFNLLSNAAKFSPPGSPIVVSARYIGTNEEDGTITISVADQGIGIDPRHHELIFEEFRQVDGTAKREFGGTGLGLALVKKFAELQGGSVRVDSAPGRGSTFSFTLPVRSRAAVVSRGAELAADMEQRVADRVLVVEDDANAYDLIASALGSAGFLCLRARHGEEALKLAREAQPVAVTLDLVLPGIDGWEVLKRLKTTPETCDIPVVIISMVDNRELGVALGADDYFVKPVDRDRLLSRLREVCASRPRPRLLLIDDDAAVHSLLGEELAGYALDSAYSGEEGLRSARANAPDAIILDLMMPGMSGFEVADSLKEHPGTANIPILVLTSKDISADERRELQKKVTTFVQKGKSAKEQLLREITRLRRV
ncbi:MAG TPA: response regulator [Thermoanaerobaculia bacterium]|jgi:signal transduction histidine kinase/CheY-like chemotaxis protein|nr:response regulator [Thermoanaerobaculia bacterium]